MRESGMNGDMTLTRLIARPMLASMFIVGGINAGVHIAGGLALATGRAPRLSALALAATLVPTTVAGHRFWEESDPAAKAQQKTHFFKNVSMLGGLLLASVDTEGRPGLAWRARHAASHVRREARHLGKSARREAKLAAKNVTG